MLKKAVFSIESLSLDPAAATMESRLDTAKVASINPPANMICTRCTIQVIGAANATKSGVVCISSQMPMSGLNGFVLVNSEDPLTGIIQPSKFTFENFNKYPWSQTIYLAAIAINSSALHNLSIIWEGDEL